MMPLFLLLTIAFVSRSRAACPASSARWPAPLWSWSVLWLWRCSVTLKHFETVTRIASTTPISNAAGNPRDASWFGLTARTEVYYDYFNPAFLFLTGRVLLLPLLVLIPAGFCQILSQAKTPVAYLSMAGFLAAPFAASLTAEAPTPGRILFITPFAAMVSAYGIQCLMSWRRWTSGRATNFDGGSWRVERPTGP